MPFGFKTKQALLITKKVTIKEKKRNCNDSTFTFKYLQN